MAAASISAGGYEVDYSCRFHGTDSTYLAFTPDGTATSTTIGTLSVWIKLALDTAVNNQVIAAGGASGDIIKFDQSNFKIESFLQGQSSGRYITTQLFRDPNAWGHLVLALDTNSGTAAGNRMRIYWNGDEITAFSTETNASADYALLYGRDGTEQVIGNKTTPGTDYQFGGYMAEFVYIDGQQLTPSSFGETNSSGVWTPIDVSELTFGNNGYYLDFADDSDLGNDVSGNNNDFTSSGLVAADQMTDTPTNNFCIIPSIDLFNSITTSDGNLVVTFGGPYPNGIVFADMAIPSTGKYYYEINVGGGGGDALGVGVSVQFNGGNTHAAVGAGSFPNGLGAAVRCDSGNKYIDGTSSSYGGAAILDNSIVGVAIDADNGTIWFSDDNTWLNSATKAEVEAGTTTNAAETGRDYGAALYTPTVFITAVAETTIICNFGQSAFTSDQPSGYLALCTTNIPVPTIADPSAQFQPNTRTGDGSAGAVAQTGNSQFGTDLIIIKNRDETDEWKVVDTGRGATYEINTDTANAQSQDSNGVTAFSATDGYTIGTGADGYNDNTEKFIDYHFQEGSTPGMGINASVSHTQGSETEIAHGMGLVPAFAMLKETDAATSWWIFHKDLTSKTANYLIVDTSVAEQTITDVWGTQTSTNFVIGDAAGGLASGTYVCYSFAEVAGFSSFGTYTSNGSADGPVIITGFKPALTIFKRFDAGNQWIVFDGARNTYNPVDLRSPLDSNLDPETSGIDLDYLSNGFKLRNVSAIFNGGSGVTSATYIYMSWAINPFGGHGGTFGGGVVPATAR